VLTADYDLLGLRAGERLLDLGCGFGRHAFEAARRGAHVVAVDLAPDELETAVATFVAMRAGGELAVDVRTLAVRADARRLPFADGAFDRVIASEVLEHIPDDGPALAELARVLRPGGLLLHGGDDHARGTAWRRWRARTEAQFGVENVGVPRARIETFLEEEGWRPAGVETVRFARRTRPRTMLELIEARSWSLTWRMSDPQLAEAVSALREDLVAAFGDLDREVEIETGFWVRAYQAA